MKSQRFQRWTDKSEVLSTYMFLFYSDFWPLSQLRASRAYKGRPAKIDRSEITRRLAEGHRPTDIARDMGVSRSTVYKVRG